MKRKCVLFITMLATLFLAVPSQAATYTVDADHTDVSFKIKHLLSKIPGHFKKFEGSFDYEAGKPETWKAAGTIDVTSIDTNVEARDKHLRSADFFDVQKFSTISFKTTGVKESTGDTAKVDGLITIHGVEKPIVLDVQFNEVVKDPWGNTHASFTATTTINRKDFGLTWNQALEAGQLLVGEQVWITLEVDGLLKA